LTIKNQAFTVNIPAYHYHPTSQSSNNELHTKVKHIHHVLQWSENDIKINPSVDEGMSCYSSVQMTVLQSQTVDYQTKEDKLIEK
jgi:hypothetical protein